MERFGVVETSDPRGSPSPRSAYCHVTTYSTLEPCKIISIGGQAGNEPLEDPAPTLDEQVKSTMSDLKRCLGSIGAGPQDILKITQYVVGYNHKERGWIQHFVDFFEADPPTNNLVPGESKSTSNQAIQIKGSVVVQSLAWPGWLYGVDAIAIIRDDCRAVGELA